MNVKKYVSAAIAALICFCFCFAAFADARELTSDVSDPAETCSVSIANKNCFFVFAGTRDTVPNKLEKGRTFSFNVVFDPGTSYKETYVTANGVVIPLEDGKYTYTINEDTVFDVLSADPDARAPFPIGTVLLILCCVSLVGVVAWTVISNKKEQKKAGNAKK